MQMYNKSTYPVEEALIIVGPSQSGKFDVFKGVLQILPSCYFSHLKCKENCQVCLIDSHCTIRERYAYFHSDPVGASLAQPIGKVFAIL